MRRQMERETGIEPATNSLEGCDSTIELLPLIPLHYSGPYSRLPNYIPEGIPFPAAAEPH